MQAHGRDELRIPGIPLKGEALAHFNKVILSRFEEEKYNKGIEMAI